VHSAPARLQVSTTNELELVVEVFEDTLSYTYSKLC
jgi:hypothetical protein